MVQIGLPWKHARLEDESPPGCAVTHFMNAIFERHDANVSSQLPSQTTIYSQLNGCLEEYKNIKFSEAKELSSTANRLGGGVPCSCPACLQTTKIMGKPSSPRSIIMLACCNADNSLALIFSTFCWLSSVLFKFGMELHTKANQSKWIKVCVLLV